MVVRHNFAGRLAAVDRAGAVVGRLGAIVILEPVLDLGFVSVLVLSRQAAEEDTAVQVLAVANAVQLQQEVVELLLGLKVAGPVGHVEPAFFRHGES